jgi:hypothetical protein
MPAGGLIYTGVPSQARSLRFPEKSDDGEGGGREGGSMEKQCDETRTSRYFFTSLQFLL